MKRTTLILHDRRMKDLKRLAAERGQTLSAVVDEFLAEGIRRASAPKKRRADRDQLWDAMDISQMTSGARRRGAPDTSVVHPARRSR